MWLVAVGLALLVAPAAAQAPQDTAARVSEKVMSPFCPGLALHDCPTQEAVELRTQIQEWAALGWSEERIIQRLEDEYGAAIRPVPGGGSGLIARSLPVAGLLGGLVLAYVLGRRWTRRAEPSPAPSVPRPTAAERSRLEQELEVMRRGPGGPR